MRAKATRREKEFHTALHIMLKAFAKTIKNPNDLISMADYGEAYMRVWDIFEAPITKRRKNVLLTSTKRRNKNK